MTTPANEHIADRVVSVGVDLLAQAVEDQAAPVSRVDWRPPLPGTEDDLATVALDPMRPDANAQALARMLAVQAVLVDVLPAHEAIGLERVSSCTRVHRSPGRTRRDHSGAR